MDEYRNSKSRWHPRSHIFDRPIIAETVAEQAIREGDELRSRLFGRRILEDTRPLKEIAA